MGRLNRITEDLTTDDLDEYFASESLEPDVHGWVVRTRLVRRDVLEAFLWWALHRTGSRVA
jgi:hypothetical protein